MFSGLENNFYTGVLKTEMTHFYVRVRVRIYGLHTDDKLLIPTPDLPWSEV